MRDYKLYLTDILKAIRKINRYSKGLTYEEFKKSDLIIDAVARNLEIIGEATKHVPKNIRNNYPKETK